MTEDATTSAEQSNPDVASEGTESTQTQTEVKTFTQAELDKIISQRLAEQARTSKSRWEKELEAKLAETKEATLKDLDKLVEERTNARIAERELVTARATIAESFGLSEEQASRLVGDTPEALQKDAEKIYGAFKKPAVPIIKTGSGDSDINGLSLENMTPAEIRANAAKLWPK